MFKALFNIIINMIASVIQIIVWPINQIIVNVMPDVSDKILVVTNTLNTVFDAITWGLGLLPSFLVETLLFIVTIEIAKHTIFTSTHMLIKVWNVFQKIKFW
jgi:hypothetical protein